MRGEYHTHSTPPSVSVELPPHARRIPHPFDTALRERGTTSACAENTAIMLRHVMQLWNYLRMRGEYIDMDLFRTRVQELPPHARRIRPRRPCCPHPAGTTSACAENTTLLAIRPFKLRNYLRMRGEYTCGTTRMMTYGELPPHARRIHSPIEWGMQNLGTTSACAENTLNELGLL